MFVITADQATAIAKAVGKDVQFSLHRGRVYLTFRPSFIRPELTKRLWDAPEGGHFPSWSAPWGGIEQREQACHALGLPNSQNKTNRNRYCVGEDDPVWSSLVAEGLATMRPAASLPFGGSALFYLTRKAAEMVLEPGEQINLDATQFPREGSL